MDLPAEHVLDHYRHPHHKVALKHPTVTHEEKNWSCGDTLTVQLQIEENRIVAIGWSGEGCAISQAAMSLLTDVVEGKSMAAIETLTSQDILALLQIPIGARRMKCTLLCLHTIKNAFRTYRKQPLLTWSETVGEI